MIYLGTLGRLVGIKCPASQDVAFADRYTFDTTLEGKRKAQVARHAPRTWTAQTSEATTPAEVGLLAGFVQGAWGDGPFVFVSADAPVTNLLTPAGASCDPRVLDASSTQGGPVLTPIGRLGRSLRHGTGTELSFSTEQVPVIPGNWVTASCFADGAGAQVRVRFFNSVGTTLSQATSGVTSTPGAMTRLSVSMVAPATAAYCKIYGVGGVTFAGPAVTWTSEVFSWGPGAGCAQAVVDSASNSLTWAGPSEGQQYSSMSFTITEVG